MTSSGVLGSREVRGIDAELPRVPPEEERVNFGRLGALRDNAAVVPLFSGIIPLFGRLNSAVRQRSGIDPKGIDLTWNSSGRIGFFVEPDTAFSREIPPEQENLCDRPFDQLAP
jgi:hypothetical protein